LVRLEGEVKEFKEELFRISWFMRGGVTISDLLFMCSSEDRDLIYTVIKENIDLTKETKMPLL
jgi:hypothetical protein